MQPRITFSSVTALALSLMTGAFGLSFITGSVFAAGYLTGFIDIENVMTGVSNGFYGLLSCLSPIVMLMELVGLVMLFSDGAQVSPAQKNLTRIAVALFASCVLLLLMASAFNIAATQSGSLALAQAAYILQSLMVIVETLAIVLGTFELASNRHRLVIAVSMAASTLATTASMIVCAASLQMKMVTVMNVQTYVAVPMMDFRGPFYLTVSVISLLGVLVMTAVFFRMSVEAWKIIREREPIVDPAA
ncbi:MAG TPA: hypothetical protein PKW33_21660 [Anaerolineaceae bacterium]|nr:hypothetical protein [Anaerolineaceae bacterium]HPN54217.1 hypothetical protein [Anaerolineaceae bacterium]